MSKRSPAAILVKRREEIQQLILEGFTGSHIVDTMSEKWKTTKRAIQEDLRQIGKDWAERAPEQTQKMRNQYADRLEMMFLSAIGKNNLKVALEIQKEIHKLSGLYAEKEKDQDKIPDFIQIGRRSPLKVVGDNES